MTVTITSQRRIGPNTWRITWTSDQPDPTFLVYRDGLLIDTTKNTGATFHVTPGETPVIEVLDDPAQRPASGFPGRITLEWYEVVGADHYRVQKQVSGTWKTRKTVRAGRWHYRWVSEFLEDSTMHRFRVLPVGVGGNPGTPLEWNVLMVRHPDPPRVTLSYDGASQTVTIS